MMEREDDGNGGRRTSKTIVARELPDDHVVTAQEMRELLEEALSQPAVRAASSLTLTFALCKPAEIVREQRGEVLSVKPGATLSSGSYLVNVFALIHALEYMIAHAPLQHASTAPLLAELAKFGQCLATELNEMRKRGP